MEGFEVSVCATALNQQKVGIGNYTDNMISSLYRTAGWEGAPHKLSILNHTKRQPIAYPAAIEEKIIPDPFPMTPEPLKDYFWYWKLSRKVTKETTNLVHNPTQFCTRGNFKVPYVVTCHDIIPISRPEFMTGTKQPQYMKMFLRGMLDSADHIVCDSRYTQRELMQFYPRESGGKTSVIYPGISRIFSYDPDLNHSMVEQLFNIREPFLLTVGGQPRKNVELIIRAMSRLKGFELCIIGPQGFGCDYQDLAEKCGVQDRVKVLGFVKEIHKRWLYNTAACFVFPSLYEGFGLPPLEAAACGCPVVSSAASSLAEVVSGYGATFDPYAETAMDDMVEGILHQVSRDREKVRHENLLGTTKFSWDKSAAQLWKVYEGLMQ